MGHLILAPNVTLLSSLYTRFKLVFYVCILSPLVIAKLRLSGFQGYLFIYLRILHFCFSCFFRIVKYIQKLSRHLLLTFFKTKVCPLIHTFLSCPSLLSVLVSSVMVAHDNSPFDNLLSTLSFAQSVSQQICLSCPRGAMECYPLYSSPAVTVRIQNNQDFLPRKLLISLFGPVTFQSLIR